MKLFTEVIEDQMFTLIFKESAETSKLLLEIAEENAVDIKRFEVALSLLCLTNPQAGLNKILSLYLLSEYVEKEEDFLITLHQRLLKIYAKESKEDIKELMDVTIKVYSGLKELEIDWKYIYGERDEFISEKL